MEEIGGKSRVIKIIELGSMSLKLFEGLVIIEVGFSNSIEDLLDGLGGLLELEGEAGRGQMIDGEIKFTFQLKIKTSITFLVSFFAISSDLL